MTLSVDASYGGRRRPVNPRPRGVAAAARRVLAARGHTELIERLFHRSHVPMVLVDDARRHVDANRPARLAFRLSLAELRQRRIDDLTPQHLIPMMEEAWARLVATGCVAGDYEVAGPDGSLLEVVYWAASDVLPGLHLIVFAPSAWPESELLEEPHNREPLPDAPLTPRELEVLGLAAEGLSGPDIARELVVSPATVRTHFERIYAKLGVRDRAAAVARAVRLGLIA